MEKSIFQRLVNKDSFRNVLCLLLSFPLGLVYFVFLVTGISLGLSLTIIWVGIPILVIVLEISRGMFEFERRLANYWFGVAIPPIQWVDVKVEGMLSKIKHRLQDPMMWKGVVYLFTKFPLGILAFVVAVTLIALSLGLITAPLTYQLAPITIGIFLLDTLGEALVGSVVGLGVGLISLWIMNILSAFMQGYTLRVFNTQPHDHLPPNSREM